ncbi:AMIN domain-containing protein [Desulforhopalus singaporensis]|uniref:Type IV pilus assembly protein PilQ n=1 Tax=Desulforhopalus singaporensis TaxID=91360 RepID=A0A1H0SE79_9BACT|nr:AMIN domain-containing protein [Desulforhopalus singaporensis]SDP39997.1 type IV pilus assembly protein PilQ [Desulforhopalus singaporensis]
MLKWLEKTKPAVFSAFCISFILLASFAKSETTVSYEITAVESSLSDSTLTYTIKGASKPVYTVTERFAPFRVVVDIAGGVFSETVPAATTMIPENPFCSLDIEDLAQTEPPIKRFVFKLADSHDYKVDDSGDGLGLTFAPAAPDGSETTGTMKGTVLTNFQIASTPKSTTVSIVANGTIENYTVDSIGSGPKDPPRMFIDIDDVAVNELVKEKKIGSTSLDRIRVAPRGNGVRIVFDSATDNPLVYSVTPDPNGLTVVIDETANIAAAGDAATADASTIDQLISSSERLLNEDSNGSSVSAKVAELRDDFTFAGYQKQRVSFDFYKIDIHNVFRLFRQITGLNIIIDEDVKGSLTLALDDVPWDFALDIILNLMELKKEEKFNTLVIYPAKKEFIWPTRAEDNLAFEADVAVIQEEALIVEQETSQTKEIMMAKELMVKAQKAEKREKFEDAASFYEQAFELWPENNKIANRLSSLYLVHMGMNAKALFYAKKSLEIAPNDTSAALYAGIGSANMQRISEAREYFTQSISGSPPMKEALLSYAAFSENNGLNDAALKLLDKYHSFYGETVDTMIAKARILDRLGLRKDAADQYLALLASGYQLRPDLRQYIQDRLADKDLK